MTSLLDKLNLRPQERRLVVGVSIVVFVVLNIWLVLPYFGELGKIQQRTRDANTQLNKFNTEVQKRSVYERQVKELEGQGNYIPSEEQASSLAREVNQQANLSGVQVQNTVPMARSSGVRTNAFFEESAVQLNIYNTGERELVDFLFSLGSQNTLVRVKTMNIRPELPARMKLAGSLNLVKSFQRKPPPKAPVKPTGAPITNLPAKPAPPAVDTAPKKETSAPAATTPKSTRTAPANIPSPTPRTNAPMRRLPGQ